jgi:hypothetical protein
VADVATAAAAATENTAPGAAALAQPIHAASVIFDTGVLNFSSIQFLTMIVAPSAAIAHCKC